MYSEAIELIKKSNRIAILSHIMPDGDNIGSSLAIYNALIKMNKNVKYILEDDIPKIYKFLRNSEKIEKPYLVDNFDLVIALDCSDMDRLGKSKIYTERNTIINIDHHISNTYYGAVNIVEPKAAATGEIVYNILKKLNVEIDKDISECIYTAIVTDTGQFQYSNTTSETHRISSELLNNGVCPSEMTNRIFQSNPKEKILLIKKALESLEFFYHDKISCIQLSKDDIKATGANEMESEGLINLARDVECVEVAFFLKEKEDNIIKVSFRSKKYVDVCKIASQFGGGGHIRASGCTIKGSIEEAKNKLINEIIKELTIGEHNERNN